MLIQLSAKLLASEHQLLVRTAAKRLTAVMFNEAIAQRVVERNAVPALLALLRPEHDDEPSERLFGAGAVELRGGMLGASLQCGASTAVAAVAGVKGPAE